MSVTVTEERPARYLAAWGMRYDADLLVEVDVWTVSLQTREEEEEQDVTPDDFSVGVEAVLGVRGNVAKVAYSGAAGVGYRYVESDRKATQQAYAGAARAAGGSRTDAGTFNEGWSAPEREDTLQQAIEHGYDTVIPNLIQALRTPPNPNPAIANEVRENLSRRPSDDEDGEAVETEPFDGFRNAVRIIVDDVYAYELRGTTLYERGGTRRGGP